MTLAAMKGKKLIDARYACGDAGPSSGDRKLMKAGDSAKHRGFRPPGRRRPEFAVCSRERRDRRIEMASRSLPEQSLVSNDVPFLPSTDESLILF